MQSFRSGYANPTADPKAHQIAPALLRSDGDNGYAQIASAEARPALIDLVREAGLAGFACANCHHLGALRFELEPLAEAGLVAFGVVNSLSMVVPHGGVRPTFGTNPMAFACPRPDQPPIVWDQASSVVALMDVKLAAAEGHSLARPGGLGADGTPTTDPQAILESRALLPFGEHKGSAIALMVEVLGAALAGGTLSTDNAEREAHGALNIKGGVTLIAMDPARWGNPAFEAQITRLCAEIEGNGNARLPGDGRLARRAKAQANGVTVSTALLAELQALGDEA
ncbi:MAG: Ldh family oxidoreductase [Pseudomonadota bacterium]